MIPIQKLESLILLPLYLTAHDIYWFTDVTCTINIERVWISIMAQCKTAVTPLLTHWSYCGLPLNRRAIPAIRAYRFILGICIFFNGIFIWIVLYRSCTRQVVMLIFLPRSTANWVLRTQSSMASKGVLSTQIKWVLSTYTAVITTQGVGTAYTFSALHRIVRTKRCVALEWCLRTKSSLVVQRSMPIAITENISKVA